MWAKTNDPIVTGPVRWESRRHYSAGVYMVHDPSSEIYRLFRLKNISLDIYVHACNTYIVYSVCIYIYIGSRAGSYVRRFLPCLKCSLGLDVGLVHVVGLPAIRDGVLGDDLLATLGGDADGEGALERLGGRSVHKRPSK